MKPSPKSESTVSSGINVPSSFGRDSRQISNQTEAQPGSDLFSSAQSKSLLDDKSLNDTCTVALMEELLEERIVKDRRKEPIHQHDAVDRRKQQRRESDQR